MRKLKEVKIVMVSLLVFALSLGICILPAFAQSFTVVDEPMKIDAEVYGLYVKGKHTVYRWYDAQGVLQIYYRNLETNKVTQITKAKTELVVEHLRVDELKDGSVVVVWKDKRNYGGTGAQSYNWDIYSYNLNTGQEKKLNYVVGGNEALEIDGGFASWSNDKYEVYVYDFTAQKEIDIGRGRFPQIAKEKVAFLTNEQGVEKGISMYDISTGKTTPLVTVDKNEDREVDGLGDFSFNGTYLLWKEYTKSDGGMGRGSSKHRVMEVNEKIAKDITSFSKKDPDYVGSSIGDTQGAWLEVKNGIRQILGVDLASGQTYDVTRTTDKTEERWNFITGIDHDRLIMHTSDGKHLLYKNIVGSDQAQSILGISATSGMPAQKESVIGVEGGQVKSSDGSFALSIPQAAFTQSTKINVLQLNKTNAKVNVGLKQQMRFVSPVWELSSDHNPDSSLKMTFKFDASLSAQQLKKISVNMLDPSTSVWQPIRSKENAQTGEITIQTNQAGIYSVILNEVTFSDVQNHWAQSSIEELAGQSIVSGMSDGNFHPGDTLTRAQFVKMLVDAAGIPKIKTSNNTFTDADTSHWANPWIEAAALAGLLHEKNGLFHPDEPITREDMMVMLALTLSKNTSIQPSAEDLSKIDTFKDAKLINSWAKPYVAISVKSGLILGHDGIISPQESTTRAEAATVIVKFLSLQ